MRSIASFQLLSPEAVFSTSHTCCISVPSTTVNPSPQLSIFQTGGIPEWYERRSRRVAGEKSKSNASFLDGALKKKSGVGCSIDIVTLMEQLLLLN